MRFTLIQCPLSHSEQTAFKAVVRTFMLNEGLKLKGLTVSWAKAPRRSKRYYGDFKSLVRPRSNVYINLNLFYELKNPKSFQGCLWATLHDLTHAKQLVTKELHVLRAGNHVVFRRKVYGKLAFRMAKFERLYKRSPKKATSYHIECIPWEADAYASADRYAGRIHT